MSYQNSPYEMATGVIEPQRPQPGYTPVFGLGGQFLNAKEREPWNFANPLTYCVVPSYSNYFDHGPSLSEINARTYQPACQNYMASYCADTDFDDYSKAAFELQTYTYYPNNVSIDKVPNQYCNDYFRYQPTQGEMMLRNAVERKFLLWPSVLVTYEPFDYTVANSPLVANYQSLQQTLGRPLLQNLGDPHFLDQSRLVQMMLDYPVTCFDVLVRIYAGIRYFPQSDVHIGGTKLAAWLSTNQKVLDTVYQKLRKNVAQYDVAPSVSYGATTEQRGLFDISNPVEDVTLTSKRCPGGMFLFKNR